MKNIFVKRKLTLYGLNTSHEKRVPLADKFYYTSTKQIVEE